MPSNIATHRFNLEFPEPLIIPNAKQRVAAPKKFKIAGKTIIVASANTASSEVNIPNIISGSYLITILPMTDNVNAPPNAQARILGTRSYFLAPKF